MGPARHDAGRPDDDDNDIRERDEENFPEGPPSLLRHRRRRIAHVSAAEAPAAAIVSPVSPPSLLASPSSRSTFTSASEVHLPAHLSAAVQEKVQSVVQRLLAGFEDNKRREKSAAAPAAMQKHISERRSRRRRREGK